MSIHLLTRFSRPLPAGLTTVSVTGTPAVAIAKARHLASLVEVTAMRHSTRHNRPGLDGQPVIRIDITYRTPAGRSR